MSNILIFTESRFPADRKKIREFVSKYLSNKISGNFEVGINIVGDRKMKQLNQKYRQFSQTTEVLAFPITDLNDPNRPDIRSGFSPDKSSPDKLLRLGDVVVSYPQVVLLAAETNNLVDKKMQEIITHGLDHLLGKHH